MPDTPRTGDLAEINTRVDEVEARVDLVEARVAVLETDLVTLDTRVDVVEADLAALTARVAALEAAEPPIDPPIDPPVPTGVLSISLAFADGTSLAFSQDQATDLGDYVGPFVRQRCASQWQGPWTVFFRPDADGLRQEIVVEYGGYDFSVSPPKPVVAPAHITTPYTATITRDGTVLATITVPKHWWLTRWRWQSAPRPIVRSLADLVAMRAHLPLSATATYNNPPNFTQAVSWSGPMGTASLQTGMGVAGDRPEIGPVTNAQAGWLLRGNAEAEKAWRAQAEAVGSFPFWLRQGDSLHDVYAHPNQGLNFTSDANKYPKLYPAIPSDASFFKLDMAHFPSVAFVPWLLTDDPYFLEGVQAQSIYGAIESNYHQIGRKLPGLSSPSQKRGWAWGIREIMRMAAFAPEATPVWLRPRSYFVRMLADNLTLVNAHMASTTKTCSIFHMVTSNTTIDSWIEGYLVSVLGWAKWSRLFPTWDAAIDYMGAVIVNLTASINDNGWDQRWPAPYRVPLLRAREIAVNPSLPAPANTEERPSPYEAQTPDSWGELWTLYRQWCTSQSKPLTIGPDDRIYENPLDNPHNITPSGPHYLEVVTGAVAALALAGVPGAREHFDWLHPKLLAAHTAYGPAIASSFRYAYLPED